MSDHTRVNEQSQNIPYGYCHCGCGQLAPIARYTNTQRGRIKGQPLSFIRNHHFRKVRPAPHEQRICTNCGQAKPLADYYLYKAGRKRGTYYAQCNACKNGKDTARRRADPDRLVKQRERARRYIATHHERLAGYWRKQYAKNPVKAVERARRAEARNPQRTKAMKAVGHEVEAGRFPSARTMVCEHCQEAQAAHWHHHKGYSEEYRLDVIAVCTVCHKKEHWL